MGTLTPLATEGDPQGQRVLRKNWTPGWLRREQEPRRKVPPVYAEGQDPLEWEEEVDIYIPTPPPQNLPLWAWKENFRNDPLWTPSNSPSRHPKSPRLHLPKAAHIFKGSGSQERFLTFGNLHTAQEQQDNFSRSFSWTHQNLLPIRKLAPLETLCPPPHPASPPQPASPPHCWTQSKSLPPRRLAPLRLPNPQPQPTSKRGARTCQSPSQRPPNRLAPLGAHLRGLTPSPPTPTPSYSEVHIPPPSTLDDVPQP